MTHIASNTTGIIEYFHNDHLGSTRLKTYSNKTVIYASDYKPFGFGYNESGVEEYRYTGKYEDNTGLYYFGKRYYNPVIGRFITKDSFGGYIYVPQSMNGYLYCMNNPQKYIDPTGNLGVTPTDINGIMRGISILGAILGGIISTVVPAAGEFFTGVLNPNPNPDITNDLLSEITGGVIVDANIEDLDTYLDESGLVYSSNGKYDETVDKLEGDIDMTKGSHQKHRDAKGFDKDDVAYQQASRQTLKNYLNNAGSDPTIQIKFDTKNEKWNVFKKIDKDHFDVIAFDANGIKTWFETSRTTYGNNINRWIAQNGVPFCPIPP